MLLCKQQQHYMVQQSRIFVFFSIIQLRVLQTTQKHSLKKEQETTYLLINHFFFHAFVIERYTRSENIKL